MAATHQLDGSSPRPGVGVPAPAAPPRVVLTDDDIGRLRRHARVTGALKALVVALLAILAGWLVVALSGGPWRIPLVLGILAIGALLAGYLYSRAASMLRSFGIEISEDAVVFTYDGTRTWIPLDHLQFIDTESPYLLRRLGLCRCHLHTGGGVVTIPVAPTRVASAIEQAAHQRAMPTQAGDRDAA